MTCTCRRVTGGRILTTGCAGYRIEEFREMHDRRLAALTKAGMWPPRLRPLEKVTARTTEESDR